MSNLLSLFNYFQDNNKSNATLLENNSFESNYGSYDIKSLDKEELEKELLFSKY